MDRVCCNGIGGVFRGWLAFRKKRVRILVLAHDTYTGEMLFEEIDRVEISTWFLSFCR